MAQIQRETIGLPTAGRSAFVGCFSLAASWGPVPVPIPPLGAAHVKALIVGNLFDPATAYVNSQRMLQAFPSASLISWQGIGHCFVRGHGGNPPEDKVGFYLCEPLLLGYLLNGTMPKRGVTCHSQLPGQFDSSDPSETLSESHGPSLSVSVRNYMSTLPSRTHLLG